MYRLAIAPEQRQGEWVTLTAAQNHYLRRVLRLRLGEAVGIMDGQGGAWRGLWQGDQVLLQDPIPTAQELPIPVTLAIALPKGNGFEEIIRPCTELGVTAFQPLITERTLLHPGEGKLSRWQRIVQEAAEQSERAWVPPIYDPLSWSDFLALDPVTPGDKFLCLARQETPGIGAYLASSPPSLIIATGPEGGWTPQEVEQAIAAGFKPLSLGRRILRAVTAPTVALAQVVAYVETHTFPA